MQRPDFFLRTKLLPPRAVSELLERPRLTEKLRDNLNSPVTMVAADAGCGKTTLIADFVRNQQRPVVWYQLDHTDADPFVFLGYVAQGIKNFAPEFGETVLPYLSEANEELIRYPERAVDLLLNEILQSIEQPFIMVLDDYHHIGRDTIVHTLVDRLLQYSSDMLHLIITTRDIPPLAIMRRRSQSAALVITRDDLLFTDGEVRELFQRTLNVDLKDDEIAEYRDRTHGWITALQLVRQVAEHEIQSEPNAISLDLHEVLRQSEKDIFDYFAEEVFARENDQTQDLLLRLALLDTMPLDICSRVFPDMHCSQALPELAQKNVFLTAVGEGNLAEEYRFHPLFRDFLLRRLRSEVGREGVAAERNRIAEFFFESNQWVKALPYLLESANYERAAQIIAEKGGEWIASGAFTSLGIFVSRVPDEFMEKYPRSLLHKSEIARLQGDLAASSGILERAVLRLHEEKDAEGEAEALHSLASLARRKGRNAEAFAQLAKAERLAGEGSETFLKCANTRGLCLIAEGEWNNAEQQFRFALELAEKQGNEHYARLITHNLALAPGFRGDFGEALRWFKRIFREGQPEKQLPQEATAHLNVARLHLYRGEFEDSEKHLEKALELSRLYNLKTLRGEIFEAYANFYREKGDMPHAGEFYERALKAYDEAGINLYEREFDEERARFYLLGGDPARARALLEHLIDNRQKADSRASVHTAKLCLCGVRLATGKTEGLVEDIAELLKFFHDQHHYYDEALSSMLLAEAFFRLEREKEMIAPLQRAIDLSVRFDYEYWLRREIRKNPAPFRNEEIFEKLPPDLLEELGDVRPQIPFTAVSPTEKAAPVTDLTIKVLGHVDIFRDASKPFAADAWTTRRARDIFCHIATSRHRRVDKDVLIDLFWPDEDFEAVEKNFHPTISHIRKALNSRQSFKQNFLVFRDGAYQLNPELAYSIDTEEFDAFITAAENAKREKNTREFRRNLEAAHSLYRGEFVAGVYENWSEERRHYYQEQFSRVLSALAKLALSEKSWSGALRFANEALKEDPYREDMHRLVMKVFAAQSKPAAVKEHFENMQTLLRQELGVDPAPETRRVFAELLKS
jgi:LuxR family transcriptional regulator, maltose regulon positive regulatory protein